MKKTFILIFQIITIVMMLNRSVFAMSKSFGYYDYPNFIKKDMNLYILNKDGEYEKIEENVRSIDKNHILKNDNSLWAYYTDTGLYKVMDDVKEVSTGELICLILKNDSSLWGYGYLSETEFFKEPIKIMNNVKEIAAGRYFGIALKDDGSVWTFGDNSSGQLGIGNNDISFSSKAIKILDNIKGISAGYDAGFAISENDVLYRWGTFYIDWETIYSTPVKYVENVKDVEIGYGYNLILKTDDTLWIYGETDQEEELKFSKAYNYINAPVQIADNVNSIGVRVDEYRSYNMLFAKNDGALYQISPAEKMITNEEYSIIKITDDVKLPEDRGNFIDINFDDISIKDNEIQEAIKHLARAGVITGTSDTEFSPNKTLTRAEIGAMLLRMTEHKYETADESVFSDVSKSDWFCGTSALCRNYGIINGYEDNTFRGNEEISKLQLIVLASRTLQNESARYNENVNTAAGIPIPDWAEGDVNTALAYGLIDEADLDNLENPITRSEAAVVLYKLYNLM